MNQSDRDDFMFALGATLEFYNKKLSSADFSFWYSAMGDRSVGAIKTALKEYVRVGKFAPRPANILELMGTNREHSRRLLPPPENTTTKCPPEIAAAWLWFLGHTCQKSDAMGSLFREIEGVDTDLQERYLHIVNEQARLHDMPGAIPDEYKLAEHWGDLNLTRTTT